MIQVIATISPASRRVETLTEMIHAGMTIARINLSHGDYAFHTESVAAVRQAAQAAGKSVVVLADLQGAKVRIGRLAGEVVVADGQELRLIYEVKPGATVLVDDGAQSAHLRSHAERGNEMGSLAPTLCVGAPNRRSAPWDAERPIAFPRGAWERDERQSYPRKEVMTHGR